MGAGPAVMDNLDRSKLRFVDVGGVRTRVYEDGEGDPLVLVHGGQYGGLYSLDAWSLNLPMLARHFHVYAFDKLGQGHTDNPKEDDYTFEALFEHTTTLLRLLGVTRGHFAGHSRGGLLVTRLALTFPDLVDTLVIVDSNTTSPAREGSGDFYLDVERRMVGGSPTRESVRVEPEAQALSTAHVTDDFLDRRLEIARLPKLQHAARRIKEIGGIVWLPSLEGVRQDTFRQLEEQGLSVPTLLIWGRDDRSATLDQGLELFALICQRTPRAELHVLNGAGHYVFREQADAFNRVLRSFCLR